MTAQAMRQRYLGDSIATASPERLLIMLYDRLLRDLEQAEQQQRDGDRVAGRVLLQHAQDIVFELRASLDVDAWDGGPTLSGIYTWLIREMVGAATSGDPMRTNACRGIAEPLAQAWRDAALAVADAREPAVAGVAG